MIWEEIKRKRFEQQSLIYKGFTGTFEIDKKEEQIEKSETELSFEEVQEDELEKAKSGIYADTPENRKLGRVGQKFGAEKSSEKEEMHKVKRQLLQKESGKLVRPQRYEFDSQERYEAALFKYYDKLEFKGGVKIGSTVTIPKTLTTDPKKKQGESGKVVKIDPKHGDIHVKFSDGVIGVYSNDVFQKGVKTEVSSTEQSELEKAFAVFNL